MKDPINYKESFIDLWNQQSKIHANNVFLRYHTRLNEMEVYKTLSYEQVDNISTSIAWEWSSILYGVKSVGFICDHSAFYLIAQLAIMKLNILFVALSPRNSASANGSLLKATNAEYIIASHKYSRMAYASTAKLDNCKVFIHQPTDLKAVSQKTYNNSKKIPKFFSRVLGREAPVMVLHSSGTTGFPKPITLSNRYILTNIRHIDNCIQDTNPNMIYNSSDVLLPCIPLFHAYGQAMVFSTILHGSSVAFMSQLPPSMKDIKLAIRANKCTFMMAPPLIIEQFSAYLKEKNDFSALQQLKLTLCGGAPIREESGVFWESKNIVIRNHYGSTETGPFMSSSFAPNTIHWNNLRPSRLIIEYCVWEPYFADPELVHLVIKGDCPSMAHGVVNREDGNYGTRDLFKETSPNSGYYSYYGRMDDTLIMKNGEKTNPLPIEATIRQCPIVSQCVIIGESRQCISVLIELSAESPKEYNTEDVIKIVYPYILEANNSAPTHSMLFKQMVYILPPGKTLPVTVKGTVVRKHAYNEYKESIDTLYRDFHSGVSEEPLQNITEYQYIAPEEIKLFLIDAAAKVLNISPNELKDTTKSLFDLGLNSILSIHLCNIISKKLGSVSQNFIFQHPNIDNIQRVLSSRHSPYEVPIEKSLDNTEEILKKYLKQASQDFEITKNSYVKGQDQVVLLTGATGSLGSFMLRDLLKSPQVSKVYCLVRGKEAGALNRIYHAFESRSLDVSLLSSPKLVALPMNLTDEKLGFAHDFYSKLKSEVTIIQHCAWLLDFNHTVEHYDKECIKGLYNLVKFAYRQINPIHLHFISSISASAGWGDTIPESPLPRNTKVAMPMGYAQSKYIVEHLFNYLTKEKNFPCIIERLGQVCGDSINGVWNTSEQYPLMFIGGGNAMKKMPSININVDWIPVDYASACIVNIMLKTAGDISSAEDSVYNIVNPRRVVWRDVLNAMRLCGMEFKTVTLEEWIAQLQQDDKSPASKLLPFYENTLKEFSEAQVWNTNKACYLFPSLEETPTFDARLLNKYIKHWKSIGFYKDK
ncbi:hypothetical protein J3Q64DRAFT_1342074 [Phycomyces blakesleeanus]|uniref:Polyketide synthase-like phosphopantetheine-binding domain-containing protein n=2 Tax=Phycomyces blakesleeanus TaxID=4837 RepID=A0A162V9Q3_PHYB8|nr:hypothetical protein PHYBLDRAFT_62102 [Phycomyces blakesleeanus NRRL 1555(-)]OAD81052.1 hypothetical protein PHYBLDRAFT_62102 [Phycomyces blakesleeanus NRRL 1555(-)]|eukprot:XP_018299092.1 hypothetical protein PHYBLDRAFT_62102 [Phycomyces blakesleeanus NRRL 1555(-)]